MGGKGIPTVLEQIKAKGDDLKVEDIVFTGFGGVLCIEAGGPTPELVVPAEALLQHFEKLKNFNFWKVSAWCCTVWRIGWRSCGGFAMPIRGGYAQDVYVVSSGEMMSLFAANNIATAIKGVWQKRLC